MTVVTAHEAPVFEAGANTITGLVAPSRGAKDVSAWHIRFSADAPSPPHSLTREEAFIILRGSLTAKFSDREETASAGGALIVPAESEFYLVAGDGPAEAICILPVGGQAVTEDGTFTPPWAQ